MQKDCRNRPLNTYRRLVFTGRMLVLVLMLPLIGMFGLEPGSSFAQTAKPAGSATKQQPGSSTKNSNLSNGTQQGSATKSTVSPGKNAQAGSDTKTPAGSGTKSQPTPGKAAESASVQMRELNIPVADSPQVAEINRLIQETLDGYELNPSREASAGEWCRRVYLDLLGRIPSVVELNDFLADRDKQRKHRLVTALVYGDRYASEFARQWTTVWTNLLIGRTGGVDNNTLFSRPGLQQYLRESLLIGKPYDEMVGELLTATGSTTPDAENFNGAVNFLAGKVREDKATLATSDTARIFLGHQIQCVQCHNHPFNDWKQEKFWQLNAFFRQTKIRQGEMSIRDGGSNELANQDFAGESRRNRSRRDQQPARQQTDDAEIFFEMRNGIVKVAYPVFIDGTEIDRSGWVSDVNRRESLANLVTESEWLGKSVSNRLWGHFLGYGFTKPVDDMGPHNPPSHPELLEYLASQLRGADYDLRALMTWITLSDAYGRSSRTTTNNRGDDPALGEPPRFSHFYLRQMAPEQLYESLGMLIRNDENTDSYEEQEKKKMAWLRQFTRAYGNDEGTESSSFNGTIPQTLMMFNGNMTRMATRYDEGSMLGSLVASDLSEKQKVNYLFLAGLGRKPQRDEKKMSDALMASYAGEPHLAYQDLWWVILNSNEFILNH